MEGYVLEISNLKRSKSEPKTEYSDMNVQTEKGTMRAVCFSPGKWKHLHQFQRDNRSCVISNVVRTKPTEVKLTNHSTVKVPNVKFDSDSELEVVEEENIIFDNIQEESLKEQLSCNKCNSTIVKTGEQIVKCSSCSSIQLGVRGHRNFAIKFVCNAKLYSCPVDVLANATGRFEDW